MRYFSDEVCPGGYERETRSSCREGAGLTPTMPLRRRTYGPLGPFLYARNRRRITSLAQGIIASLGTRSGKDEMRETITEERVWLPD